MQHAPSTMIGVTPPSPSEFVNGTLAGLFRANTKAPKIGEFRFEGAEASTIAWSPDDKSLAAGSGSGAVAVLRVG